MSVKKERIKCSLRSIGDIINYCDKEECVLYDINENKCGGDNNE